MSSRPRLVSLCLVSMLAACQGAISDHSNTTTPPGDNGGATTTGAGGSGNIAGSGPMIGEGGGGGMTTTGAGGAAGSTAVASVGPGTLRVLTRSQLVNSLTDLLGPIQLGDTGPDNRQGDDNFFSVGATYVQIGDGEVQLYHDALKAALTTIFANQAQRTALLTCTPSSATDMGCFQSFISGFLHRAWRRPPTPAEIQRYVSLASSAATMLMDPIKGLMYATLGMLESPNFLYRVEVGAPDSSLGGRYKYTSEEMASRLSYWLWNTTPDPMLLQMAEAGMLATPAGVQSAMAYLLKSDRAKAGITEYASELFKLDEVSTRSKDMEPRYTQPLRDAMVSELQMMWQSRMTAGTDVLDLFTTNQGFANATLAAIYGMTGVTGTSMVPITYPSNQNRVGVLGTGAFLAEQAKDTDTSPTQRGLFVVEHVLCRTIPPPPANVNQMIASPDPKTGLTKRQILEMHVHDPLCAGCHSAFDPVGFAFENYDWVGAFRTMDGSGKPVDPSGDISDIGKWSNLVEMANVLKGLPETKSCLVQNLYSFIQGHEAKDHDKFDDDTLTQWGATLEKDGHQLVKFFTDLAASDGFRYASPPPVDTSSAGH